MKEWRVSGIKLALGEKEETLRDKVASCLCIKPADIDNLDILKKALDARRNKPPHFVYVVKIRTKKTISSSIADLDIQEIKEALVSPQFSKISSPQYPIVVVGSGPAGLFAAYLLTISGLRVLLLERGTPVEERIRDVKKFWEEGILKPTSNVLFGEGGAGTFSDGKLTSRTKNPYSLWVKKILTESGAPGSILTDAKSHIGTDILRKTIINLRGKLLEMGCAIRFNAQVTDFVVEKSAITAIIINENEEIKTKQLVLAIGQSADDTYVQLWKRGVKMEPKPFAIGLRVEHPQELINSIQYGKWSGHPQLPPAEYFITAAAPSLKRSIYTFCMCPGGAVIGCSAFPGYLLTNGMSNYKRDGKLANSAVVVNIVTDDFSVRDNPLAGLDFRKKWEKEAFLLGGNNYCAPAERLIDFLAGRQTGILGRTSYRPGVKAAPLRNALPQYVADALCIGLREFDKKMKGFITEDAHLIGVETRTSSPLRICRGEDGQSESVQGIYPCGEGAGYAGGIISSALDGIRAAEKMINNIGVRIQKIE